MQKKLLLLIFILFFYGCSKNQKEELLLSTNSWIGYSPLFYAKEMGYLDELNIELIPTVSLGESLNLFLVSKADMLTGTQHEYNLLHQEMHSVVPIVLFDRSDGGDMILSNRTLQELKNLHKSQKIDVYLEVDSVNKEMIEHFIKHSHLSKKSMHFINKDQAQIQNIISKDENPTIIVTYAPYNVLLEKKGFIPIASTKDINTLLVIDALFTSKKTLQQNKKRFENLKRVIDNSIHEIQKDPHEAYKRVSKYLNEISYEEFEISLQTIKWINKPSEELLRKINTSIYSTQSLIK